MGIGELSRRTGVSRRALRYYEEQRLLDPERRPSGYREYDETAVRTVAGIRTLLAAGLGTSVSAEILPCSPDSSPRSPSMSAPMCWSARCLPAIEPMCSESPEAFEE